MDINKDNGAEHTFNRYTKAIFANTISVVLLDIHASMINSMLFRAGIMSKFHIKNIVNNIEKLTRL